MLQRTPESGRGKGQTAGQRGEEGRQFKLDAVSRAACAPLGESPLPRLPPFVPLCFQHTKPLRLAALTFLLPCGSLTGFPRRAWATCSASTIPTSTSSFVAAAMSQPLRAWGRGAERSRTPRRTPPPDPREPRRPRATGSEHLPPRPPRGPAARSAWGSGVPAQPARRTS